MDTYIMGLITDMLTGTTKLGSGAGSLTKTPATFNTDIYNGIMSVSHTAIMPIAYVILGLIFMLEIYNITIRTDGMQGTMGYEIPFRVMFKLAICKLTVDSTPLILGAIYQISNQAILNIGSVFSSSSVNVAQNIHAIQANIQAMDPLVQIMTSVQVTLIW